MGSDGKKFGNGPRELAGAFDLISHYKLLPHHDFFCKKPLPLAISDTHYLHNVVGDTEIRKGEGMELDQLVQNAYLRDKPAYIEPFDMETLGQDFQLRETAPVDLPSSEKGIPTISGKPKSESKDKEKKHKKHKDKDREKDKEHKKHKHRHKDRSKDKDKEKDKDSVRVQLVYSSQFHIILQIGKKIKVGIMILVAIQSNIMRRRGSTREQRIQRMCISTRRVSTRVPKMTRWGMDLANYIFS